MQVQVNENGSRIHSTSSKLDGKQRGVLQDALSVFRIPSVYNHLMNVSPKSDASIILSPLQQLHSVTIEAGASYNNTKRAVQEASVLSSESMIIPAYNKEGMNFGFIVSECYGLFAKEFPTESSGVSTARFVGCEKEAAFTGIANQPLVNSLFHVKTKNRFCESYTFMFPSGTFQKLIGSNLNDVSAFESALCAITLSHTMIECLFCGAPEDEHCDCPNGMLSAKSPLDLEVIKLNMMQFKFGIMDGKALYKLFGSTGKSHTIPIDISCKLSAQTRNGCARRLTNFALEEMFKSMHIGIPYTLELPSPLECSMPTENNGNDCSANVENCLTALTSTPNELTISDMVDDPIIQWNTASYANTQVGNADLSAIPHEQGNDDAVLIPSPISPIPQASMVHGVNAQPFKQTTSSASGRKQIAPRALTTAALIQTSNVADFDNDEVMRQAQEQVSAWKAYKRKIRNRESAARSNEARKQKLALECGFKHSPSK